MNQFNLSGYNLQTKIYWGFLFLLSLGALGLSSYLALSSSPAQFAVLAGAVVILGVLSQYQPKFSTFRITFSAHIFIILWAIVWLGVAGGVFLSLTFSAATYLSQKDKGRWLTVLLCNVIATFSAGTVFYVFLQNVANFNGTAVANGDLSALWLIPGFLIMTAVHYLLYTVLFSIYLKVESEYPFLLALAETFVTHSATYIVGVLAAVGTHFIFIKFGIWFGLVMLPTAVAGHLAYRIHFQKLAQKTREITESSRIQLATVEVLATAIDARDQVGLGHVRRTQIYAVGLGEILGLGSDEIQALRTGALLHDIGKLGVPDHILNKPGRLTPAEMEKMKIHSTVGAAILEKVNFPYPVVPTVLYHHESWDGTGYPKGLAKDKIPLTARILSIADAYDTLRGARPYRRAVNRDEARRALLHGAGAQFDPKLVDLFLRNLRQFEVDIEAVGLSYQLDIRKSDLMLIGDTDADDGAQSYVEQIKRANREVSALYELAKVFSSSLNLPDTLALLSRKIGELVPFDTCVIYLLNKNEEYAEAAFAEGKNADAMKGRKVKAGEGATGYVLKKRLPVYNINPGLDFSFYQLDFIQDYTAMASLPMIANEKLIGAVSLYSCELENYQDEHMRLLETVSRIASDAILKSVHHAETETHALTDPMTNLPNARNLQIHFENEAARSKRSGKEFQLIMLDLDGFKKVNDTFGHKVGDALLKGVSKVMRDQLREYDFLARYAGDEFVAIIPDTDDVAMADLCQRMEKAVLAFKLPIGDGRHASVGASIGSACYPKNGESLDQVIIAADHMMYSVKAEHKQKAVPQTPAVTALEAEKAASDAEERIQITEDSFIVELDESHIISSAIN